MSDLISRSEAIKKLREYADQKHFNGEVELANGILKAVCFIKKESNIPTEVKDDWIPVSEAPKKAGRYLCDIVVHCDDGNARRIVIAKYDGQWRNAKGTEILAWQPLPTEYKQKGAER